MQQEQPQYYRAVKASERPAEPNKDLYLIVFGTTKDVGRIIPETGKYQSFTAKSDELSPDDIEYLEPIPIPDADRLREALKSIEQYSDPGSCLKAIVDMKAIATEVLSAVGDGWVRVDSGKLPDAGYQVMAFNGFSKQIYLGSYLNGKWIFHGQERGNITHWRHLPSPPLNK